MKRILLALGLCLLSAPAWSACAVTNLTVKDAAGSPVTALVPYADDGSGGSNCSPQIQIKQGGNVAAVTAGNALKTDASATTQPVSGTVTAAQATAANLNATVVGTGTFATQAAQSGTWNITNVSGTVSLPTGAATAANQATEISSLATIATNTGAAIPTQAVTVPIGGVTNDPCQYSTKTNAAIATSSGTVQLVAPSGSTQVYVCSVSLIAAATAVVNLVGGTGATCTTGTPVAALGSTTAASGMSLAANGGLTFGNGGATVVRTTTAGHGLCLIQSGTTALAGNITYVQQ